MSTQRPPALDHNVAVMKELAREVSASMNGAASFAYGLVVGLALTGRAPKTAEDLRHEIERLVSDRDFNTPEESEVAIRRVVDLFDRRADE